MLLGSMSRNLEQMTQQRSAKELSFSQLLYTALCVCGGGGGEDMSCHDHCGYFSTNLYIFALG